MVVCLRIVLIDKMRIIGTYQFDAIFLCQFDEHLVRLLLQWEGLAVGSYIRITYLMSLEFQILILSEDPFVPLDGLP